MSARIRPQTAGRRIPVSKSNAEPAPDADSPLPEFESTSATSRESVFQLAASTSRTQGLQTSVAGTKRRPHSALAATTATRPLSAVPRVSSASRLRTQAESERAHTAGLSRPPTGMSRASRSASPGPPQLDDLAKKGGDVWMGQLLTLMKSVNKWNVSLDISTVCKTIRTKAVALVQAESAAIFLVDDGNSELILQSSSSPFCRDRAPTIDETVHVPYGKGIVGTVAKTGEVQSTFDVSRDQLYDEEFDAHACSNGRIDIPPVSMLCVPWFDPSGDMIALLQVTNKRNGLPFTPQDENMLQLLGMKAATVLRCCDLHMRTVLEERSKRSEGNADASRRLAEAMKAMNRQLSDKVEDVLVAAAGQVEDLITADFCTVFLLDDEKNALWSVSTDQAGGRMVLQPSMETTSGYCFLQKETLNVENVYQDTRFNGGASGNVVDNELDDLLNPDKCGVCCIPLRHALDVVQDPGARGQENGEMPEQSESTNAHSKVFGVVEVLKRSGIQQADQALLEEFAAQVAQMLFAAQDKLRRKKTLRRCSAIATSASREQAMSRAHRALCASLRSKFVDIIMRDPATNEFLRKSPQGDLIRIPQAGLSGYTVRLRQTLNLSDVRGATMKDGSEFNPSLEGAGCPRAVTFLAVPLLSGEEKNETDVCHGVLVAVNKTASGEEHKDSLLQFSSADEELATLIAQHLVLALERCFAHDQDKIMKVGCELMLRAAPQLHCEFDIRRMLKLIGQDLCEVLGANHCTPYIVEVATGELWTKVEGLRREIRLSKGQGVAGAVALSGKLVHIKDGDEARQVLGETSDKLTGGVVRSMLCCAVVGTKGNIMAVLQAFHSQPRAFGDVHESLIQLYSRLVAVALENQVILVENNQDVLQGLPVDWERDRIHRCLSKSIENQLDCDKAMIYECVSPWDRFLSVPRSSSKSAAMSTFPTDKGVVGSVFSSGNTVMTEHPQLLSLFDPEIDQPTKKEARTLLCVPMYDNSSVRVGVALALNKRKGSFGRWDEATMKALGMQFGEVLSSRQKHADAQASIRVQNFFLEANKGLTGFTDLRSVMSAINKYTEQLFQAQASSVFKYDRENGRLLTFDGNGGELRIPLSNSTVAGYACQTGEVLRIADVYEDSRFNKQPRTAHETANMLCCPAKQKSDVLAIIQCVRYHGEKFTLQEETQMLEYAKQVVAPAFNAFHQNRPAYRIFSLVDDFCTLSAEVKSRRLLTQNIKKIVRKALSCEKVNVYTVDVMRQELVGDVASGFEEDIEALQEQVRIAKARFKGHSTSSNGRSDEQDGLSQILDDCNARLNHAIQQRDRMAGSFYRFSFGHGIVGKVAETGGFQNIHDASDVHMVDCEQFSALGVAVKTMLCQCAYNAAGDMVGVIQAINKKHGVFTNEDEFLLERLSGHAGVMLYHAETLGVLDKSSRARFKLCEFAVKVVQCTDDIGVVTLMEEHGKQLLGTRTCTLWIHDSIRRTLWTLDENKEIKSVKIRELSTSVVGRAAISGEVEIQTFDMENGGLPTSSEVEVSNDDPSEPIQSKILSDVTFRSCAIGQPVLGKKSIKEMLGVIECHNKRGGVFDEEDKYVMELLGTITAGALEHIRDNVQASNVRSSKPQYRRLSVEGF